MAKRRSRTPGKRTPTPSQSALQHASVNARFKRGSAQPTKKPRLTGDAVAAVRRSVPGGDRKTFTPSKEQIAAFQASQKKAPSGPAFKPSAEQIAAAKAKGGAMGAAASAYERLTTRSTSTGPGSREGTKPPSSTPRPSTGEGSPRPRPGTDAGRPRPTTDAGRPRPAARAIERANPNAAFKRAINPGDVAGLLKKRNRSPGDVGAKRGQRYPGMG